MKVVFLEEVEGTARIGEVKDVRDGFARNYLLPRNLAAPATAEYIKRANAAANREAKRQAALDEEGQVVVAALEGKSISITTKVGEKGRLFGSVTTADIAEEVAKLLRVEEFDRRKVALDEPIKEAGVHSIRLRITRNVETTIDVTVAGEGGLPEPEAEATAEEPAAAEAVEEEPMAEETDEADETEE